MNIPGYQIERELGHGGMATVYLAVQENLGRQVALKVMAPALAADRKLWRALLARSTHGGTAFPPKHPGGPRYRVDRQQLLPVHGIRAGRRPETTHPPGGVAARAGSPDPQASGRTLGYAHEKGFVHRDVKPENILFREIGSVVLTDFGIAKAIGSGTQMTGTGMTIGTAHYMSPEQAQGRSELDGRSDLYSLGIVFYEMLVGRVPYEADNTVGIAMQHVQGVLPEPS